MDRCACPEHCCDGWTCARCASPHDVAAAGGGEQSLTAAELEVVALRQRVAELESSLEESVKHGKVGWALAIERAERLVELRGEVSALRAALDELQDVYCSGLTPSPAEHDALMARVNAALGDTP